MKYLKVAAPQWRGYTGVLGSVEFKNGVSVLPLSRRDRDRLSAGMAFMEVDAEGNETVAGVAHRLVAEAHARAPVLPESPRQTEREKKAENLQHLLKADQVPEVFYTKEELEKLADKSGIKGLREISDNWNVKSRSIPTLIDLILAAQSDYLAERNRRIQVAGGSSSELPEIDQETNSDGINFDESNPASENGEDAPEKQGEISEDDKLILAIAEACHEANRAYCLSLNDTTQLPWAEAPEWQKKSAIAGVKFAIDNPDAPDSAQHDAWLHMKVADGWVFGEIKDQEAKTHPCLVPFDQLPAEQQEKDRIFRRTVIAALSGPSEQKE